MRVSPRTNGRAPGCATFRSGITVARSSCPASCRTLAAKRPSCASASTGVNLLGLDYGTPLSRAEQQVTVTIDGNAVTVPAGTSIMRAAVDAGIQVPKLCATDSVEAFGSCRLCLVEIDGRSGTPASCTTPVADGMAVVTHSERLQRLRKGVMELYLSDHPAPEQATEMQEMAEMVESTSPDALLGHLPMLHDLAEKSPQDLTDEWQVFLRALDDLDQAIKDAGVKPSEFEDGKPPAGLSAAETKAITDAASRIRTDDVVQASSGIEQQGRDVCKVNLGL